MQKSERPDWVSADRQIGVEVVSTEPAGVQKQKDYYLKNNGNPSKDGLNRMLKDNCAVGTIQINNQPVNAFFWTFGEEEKETVFGAIKKKLQKTGYQKLNRIDLFVCAWHYPKGAFRKEDFARIFKCEEECGETKSLHFDKIYIDFQGQIAVCDMNTHTYEILDYQE